jgi:DNA-binding NarL/FixJ family response regulator
MWIRRNLTLLVLLAAAAFFAYDIGRDAFVLAEWDLHLLAETLIFAAVLTALALDLRRMVAMRRQLAMRDERIARLSGELQQIMEQKFDAWGLSPSEADVALLLIKGLSMREISQGRNVKEKTVRAQASSIYAKSSCPGRHELAAHFIEDLLGAGVGRPSDPAGQAADGGDLTPR